MMSDNGATTTTTIVTRETACVTGVAETISQNSKEEFLPRSFARRSGPLDTDTVSALRGTVFVAASHQIHESVVLDG